MIKKIAWLSIYVFVQEIKLLGSNRDLQPVKLLLVIYIVVLLIVFLCKPLIGGGWIWDIMNSLGFSSFAAILYLTFPNSGARYVRGHELLAYTTIVITLGHAFWFLIEDAASVEYVRIGAPYYMWAGIGSLAFLLLSVWISVLPARVRIYQNHSSFKFWHRVFAILTIVGALYHILGSGFYLATVGQVSVMLIVTVFVCCARNLKLRIPQSEVATTQELILITIFTMKNK